MLIKRKCPFYNVDVEMEIDVTEEQIKTWENGQLIQNVMPELTPDEREFLMTGIRPEV